MADQPIDWLGLLSQVRKDADPRDKRLFEQRIAEEHADEQRELSGKSVTLGPPPEAQLVYDHARGSVGVAIRGARRVVELPKGYGGAGAELGMIDDGMFVLTQPDRSPLMINPHTGIARPF